MLDAERTKRPHRMPTGPVKDEGAPVPKVVKVLKPALMGAVKESPVPLETWNVTVSVVPEMVLQLQLQISTERKSTTFDVLTLSASPLNGSSRR